MPLVILSRVSATLLSSFGRETSKNATKQLLGNRSVTQHRQDHLFKTQILPLRCSQHLCPFGKVASFSFITLVVDLDGLLHVVVARPLRVLVDVLETDVGLCVVAARLRLLHEVPDPDGVLGQVLQVARPAHRDHSDAVLLKLLVGHVQPLLDLVLDRLEALPLADLKQEGVAERGVDLLLEVYHGNQQIVLTDAQL